jgi:hypothetical protein
LTSILALKLDICKFSIIHVIKTKTPVISTAELKKAIIDYIHKHKDVEIASLKIESNELNILWQGKVAKLNQINLNEEDDREIKIQMFATDECLLKNQRLIDILDQRDSFYPNLGNFKSTPSLLTLQEMGKDKLKNLPEFVLENQFGYIKFENIDVTNVDFSYLALMKGSMFFIRCSKAGNENNKLMNKTPYVTFKLEQKDMENVKAEDRTRKLKKAAENLGVLYFLILG